MAKKTVPPTQYPLAKKLDDLATQLNAARSAINVSWRALDSGDTDLEVQAATVLQAAYDRVNDVYDELVTMRIDADRVGLAARLSN